MACAGDHGSFPGAALYVAAKVKGQGPVAKGGGGRPGAAVRPGAARGGACKIGIRIRGGGRGRTIMHL